MPYPLLNEVVDNLKSCGKCPSEHHLNATLKVLAVMAGIKKNVTTHVARHSFAVRCAELGISIETTAELMGVTVKTCQIYYRITGRKIDQEVERWEKL